MNFCPPELIELYREGRLIVFSGAGISASVTWVKDGNTLRGPTWRELVDSLAIDQGFSNPSLLRVRGSDLQILEYLQLKDSSAFQKLANKLVREQVPPDDALGASPIHSALAALNKCGLFYTTNYDDFIERSFKLKKRSSHVVVLEDHMHAGSQSCEVVKFHGDWNHPQKMVISESDYERRLKLSDILDYRLRSDLLNRTILFIGYSFRDPNVSYLFRLINEQFHNLPHSSSGRRAYITVADPSEFEKLLFRNRNIEVIPIRSLSQGTDTAQLLRELEA